LDFEVLDASAWSAASGAATPSAIRSRLGTRRVEDEPSFLSHRVDGATHVFWPGPAFRGDVFEDSTDVGGNCEPVSAPGTLIEADFELPPSDFVRYVLRELPKE
jgi:hypothetical protein